MLVESVGLKIVTWNLTKLALEHMHLAVEELRVLFGGRFILCVQETQDWPRGEDCNVHELIGWRVKHDAGSRVAFLWQESVIGSSIRGEFISTEHAAGIVVGEVALVNSYLPPDDHDRFLAAMRDTDFVRASLRARGAKFSAWCGDWNTELPEVEGIVGPTGKNQNRSLSRASTRHHSSS